MKSELIKISKIDPDQSLVCILGKAEVPEFLKLNKTEKEYALKQLKAKVDHVYINSYFRSVYLVKVKENIPLFKAKEELRKTASGMKKLIKSNNHQELIITSSDAFKGAVEAYAEGLLLSFYSFNKYKSADEDDKKKNYPSKLLLFGDIAPRELKWLRDLSDAVYMVRDLINEPVNHLNAPGLAKAIEKMGKDGGFRVEVLTKGKIEALKMGGLLAVNKGSIDPPVFCILEWKPAKPVNKRPLVLVGKGIVYDTGGLNIKTGDYMANMKGDMAGAATVTGVMYTAAMNEIPLHIIALAPATDNRPGGNAYTQGDIIRMHNGMSVEIGNTDAEGRLILADAISYASKFKPELIIDIATLTGSAAVTFSDKAIAMMTNADRKYIRLLEECGEDVYERVAELPFWEEYGEMIKSDVADIRNVGTGREAGAITAGKFLEKFTEYPLIHLDIAGTGSLKQDDYYRTKDGPASGLRLLASFVRKLAADYKKI
jgi:leucyl aminopeptidase